MCETRMSHVGRDALPLIQSLHIVNTEGKRVYAQYYGGKHAGTPAKQSAWDAQLLAKTRNVNARGETEIILLEDSVVLFKTVVDVTFMCCASAMENELIADEVLEALIASTDALLGGEIEQIAIEENLDVIMLLFDELIDAGIPLELDPQILVQRVNLRGGLLDMGELDVGGIKINEQTLTAAFNQARDQLTRQLLR